MISAFSILSILLIHVNKMKSNQSMKSRRRLPIVEFRKDRVLILDQRLLPGRVRVMPCRRVEEVARAIETLAVRGAPAIGVAAACGVALAAARARGTDARRTVRELRGAIDRLSATRPTARNLFWAMERLKRRLQELSAKSAPEIREGMMDEANRLVAIEEESNRRIGEAGAGLVPNPSRVLTHCNTGPLATGSYGTALGVVIEAVRRGAKVHVFATETRPLFQGARLTCWELRGHSIPCTLVIDSAAASIMKRDKIDLIIVGADRIASNGDTANKVGTFPLACAASRLGIPFYVAAPLTTIDRSIANGGDIVIEERSPEEVHTIAGRRIAARGIRVMNPAFDVTPADLIAGIVTDRGVLRPPYIDSISGAMEIMG